MNIREQVTISGIPLIWSTNLDDSALQEFYSLYRHAIFAPPTGPLEISVIVRYVEFRDGICLWMVFANRHTVLFRTRDEFELWQARRNELSELRQEQDAEQAAERQLLITEDGHHEAQTEAALHNSNYDTAAAHVFARAELHSKCADLWSMPLPWSLWRSDFPFIFTKFPNSKYGMEFLRHYDMRRQAWTNFAHWYATRRRAENQEYELQTGLIYEEAFKHFPDDGFLFQAASLFWRRQRNYARAVEICKTAIAKGLRDGTKSGFEGRVRRLEKEARTAENSSALA